MKRYLLLFITLFFLRNVLANGVDFELNRVKLPDAINIIYSEIFKRPFMLSPELVNDERLLTFKISADIDARQFIERYFSNMNIKIWDKNGVDYIAVYVPKPASDIVKNLLPTIDIVTDEILVTGYVVEVSTTAQEGNGLSFIANLFNNKLGISINSDYNPTSGNLVTFSSGSFNAVAELFNRDSHFRVISSPQLRVKNGSNSSFSVGSDVPVIGSITYEDGKPVQSIEYRSSGVLFNIVQH